MTSMTRFQKIFFRFLETFVLLVTFELLSHYPNIDSSHWLRKDVIWITDEVFREKRVLNGSDTFTSQFPTEFLLFAYFCCCFHSHKTYCDALLITIYEKYPLSSGHIGVYLLTSAESN